MNTISNSAVKGKVKGNLALLSDRSPVCCSSYCCESTLVILGKALKLSETYFEICESFFYV